jgi:hypothetical protein
MEPFTLTIWLWMGMRFEETQIRTWAAVNASSGS